METLKEILEKVEANEIDISQWLDNFPEELKNFVLATNYYWGLAS